MRRILIVTLRLSEVFCNTVQSKKVVSLVSIMKEKTKYGITLLSHMEELKFKAYARGINHQN